MRKLQFLISLIFIIYLQISAQDTGFLGFPFDDDPLYHEVTYGETTTHSVNLEGTDHILHVQVQGGTIEQTNSQTANFTSSGLVNFSVIWDDCNDIQNHNSVGFLKLLTTSISNPNIIGLDITFSIEILFEYQGATNTYTQQCAFTQKILNGMASYELYLPGECSQENLLNNISGIPGYECCNLDIPEFCRDDCKQAQEELDEVIENNSLTLDQKLIEINTIKNNNPDCTSLNLRCN